MVRLSTVRDRKKKAGASFVSVLLLLLLFVVVVFLQSYRVGGGVKSMFSLMMISTRIRF